MKINSLNQPQLVQATATAYEVPKRCQTIECEHELDAVRENVSGALEQPRPARPTNRISQPNQPTKEEEGEERWPGKPIF